MEVTKGCYRKLHMEKSTVKGKTKSSWIRYARLIEELNFSFKMLFIYIALDM